MTLHIKASATFKCGECRLPLLEVRQKPGDAGHDLRCPRCDRELLAEEKRQAETKENR